MQNEYYTQTKLTPEDISILKEIFISLEDITIPTTFQATGGQGHQVRTGTVSQREARQTSFGTINFQGKQVLSSSTKKYPHILPLLKKFIESHCPQFEFNSVYVNRNTVSKEHYDSRNVGESLLVGLGPYTHGRTVLYLPTRKEDVYKEKKCHIKTNSIIFNGSEIRHKSEPFKGIRYSLVFFK